MLSKSFSREAEFGIAPLTTKFERSFEKCYSDPFMLVAHKDHELQIQPDHLAMPFKTQLHQNAPRVDARLLKRVR